MSIAGGVERLLELLNEKEKAIFQRVEAMQGGIPGKARYIEQFVYPVINGRVSKQIEVVNKAFYEI